MQQNPQLSLVSQYLNDDAEHVPRTVVPEPLRDRNRDVIELLPLSASFAVNHNVKRHCRAAGVTTVT